MCANPHKILKYKINSGGSTLIISCHEHIAEPSLNKDGGVLPSSSSVDQPAEGRAWAPSGPRTAVDVEVPPLGSMTSSKSQLDLRTATEMVERLVM